MRHDLLRSSLAALSIASSLACGRTVDDDGSSTPATEAPLVGTVTLGEGDCMPVTTPERCRVRGIATRVEAYAMIRLEKGPRSSYTFAVPPNVKPVRTTTSDAEGRFSLVLPEGRYTVLTSYAGEWYPSTVSSDGQWAPVEVNAGWLEDLNLVINRATD